MCLSVRSPPFFLRALDPTDAPRADKVYIGGLAELQAMRKADVQGLLQGRR